MLTLATTSELWTLNRTVLPANALNSNYMTDLTLAIKMTSTGCQSISHTWNRR